ncbi:MAG: hypothetical protein C0473_02975 [Cyanobacteria bacterium DS3.002]|nr:hypothetical protein [Cyanobacteria bacterium DS3.002]MBA4049841.1 hypothetical protein [Cyanobacteria bacterium DS2.008]MBA4076346.1 hypothetical protein [Cyanobacteria bacterium PR.023]
MSSLKRPNSDEKFEVSTSSDSPLFLRDLWAYRTLFVLSAILVAGSGYYCFAEPRFLLPLSLLFVLGLIILFRLFGQIRWRIAAGEAVCAGRCRDAQVSLLKYPAGYASEVPFHILVDSSLLLPVSKSQDLQALNLQEILCGAAAEKKVFLLKDSDLTVAVAVGDNYLLVAQPHVISLVENVLRFILLAIILISLKCF